MTAPIPSPEALAPILLDLGVESRPHAAVAERRVVVANGRTAGNFGRDDVEGLRPDGLALLVLEGEPDERALAALRESLWPRLHAVAYYRLRDDATLRRSHAGGARLAPCQVRGTVLALRRREHVLSPEATREKFDANAAGWDDDPQSPSYPHFRWMRRYVATFALPAKVRRVLDFGCGAGWVGIEAATRTNAELAAFDPSPQMVENTRRNARASGIANVDARVGFGEAPPFRGEEPFDFVVSAGVISFSPDTERWLDGLAACVAPGGRLVVADLNPRSHGMRKRRRTKALVPIRELNAVTAERVREGLELRGFHATGRSDYQLSWPVPQVMHLNETRLRGALSHPLVWLNGAASLVEGLCGGAFDVLFDSWVQSFERRL